jgi:hypothetical protein
LTLLFRKAPVDGTFTVTLSPVGYGDAYFDEFRVEVIEELSPEADPALAAGHRRPRGNPTPNLHSPNLPGAAAVPTDGRRHQR